MQAHFESSSKGHRTVGQLQLGELSKYVVKTISHLTKDHQGVKRNCREAKISAHLETKAGQRLYVNRRFESWRDLTHPKSWSAPRLRRKTNGEFRNRPPHRNPPVPPQQATRGIVLSNSPFLSGAGSTFSGRINPGRSSSIPCNPGPARATGPSLPMQSLPQPAHSNVNVAQQNVQTLHTSRSVTEILRDLPLPGLYSADPQVPQRPPRITEEAIKEFKEIMVTVEHGQGGLKKDIHRYMRVVYLVGEFVREHNDRHKEDPYMQYRWYASTVSSDDITASLLCIIEDNARSIIPHLYSMFTYNDAYRRDGSSMESLVASVATDPMFDPLTQTLRVFGIRRLIQEKMTTKKKTRDRRERRNNQRLSVSDIAPSLPPISNSELAASTVPDLPHRSAEVPHQMQSHGRSAELPPVPNSEFVPSTVPDVPHRSTEGPHQMQAYGRSAAIAPQGPLSPAANSRALVNEALSPTRSLKEVLPWRKAHMGSAAHMPSASDERYTTRIENNGAGENAEERSGCASTDVVRGNSFRAYTSSAATSQHRRLPPAVSRRSAGTPTKGKSKKSTSRKRTIAELESSESGSSSSDSDCTSDSEELAKLMERVKQLEKRSTKKKGKKTKKPN